MTPRWRRLSGGAVAVASALAVPAQASAATNGALDLQCPGLGPGDYAAVEATARAELSEVHGWDLDVVIACGVAATIVRVRSGVGPPVQRPVPGALDEGSSLDELLAALQALITEARLAARDAEPLDPEDIPPPDPPRHLVRAGHRPDYRFALLAGLDGEMWSAPYGPAVGPRAGVRVARNYDWSVELDGGFLSGTQSTEGLGATSVQATLRVDFPLPYHFRIGFAGDARVVMAASNAGTSPSQQVGTTMGSILLTRYTLRVDRFELSVGPQAELFFRPVVVLVQGAELFRLPTLTAGLSLEAVAEFAE
jgi:hypothetical protein